MLYRISSMNTRNFRHLFGTLALGWTLLLSTRVLARTLPDDVRVKLEALNRLKGVDLQSNPSLQAAVTRIVEQTRGEPEFVGLVKDFQLPGQEAALADWVRRHPDHGSAVDALRLLLNEPEMPTLHRLLMPEVTNRVEILKALGQTGDRRIVPTLQTFLFQTNDNPVFRHGLVTTLLQVNEGAQGLLALGREKKLPEDIREAAVSGLRSVRWDDIRKAADSDFPAAASKTTSVLPPISELVKMTGDSHRGAAVFRRENVGCIGCHRVNGEGIDFGPALSEIGSKLGKDALCVAILEPSAGISFGYEAWSFEFKSGDEAFGLIASETEDEVAIKVPGGIVTRYKKSDITKREKQALSIMPAGLQDNLTTREFVDLIEYLASLKKAGP